MYAISILIKNSALSQSFYYDHFASADEAYKSILSETSPEIYFEDDYNSKGHFLKCEIAGVSFTDIKRDMDKQGAMELLRQKAIARAQKMAQHDTGLNLLSNGVSRPAILNGN